MIDEFLLVGSRLPPSPADEATREYQLLLRRTALSLCLQFLGEFRSAKMDFDASALKETLDRIRGGFAVIELAREEEEIIADAFDCARWAVDGADFNALPPRSNHRNTSGKLGRRWTLPHFNHRITIGELGCQWSLFQCPTSSKSSEQLR